MAAKKPKTNLVKVPVKSGDRVLYIDCKGLRLRQGTWIWSNYPFPGGAIEGVGNIKSEYVFSLKQKAQANAYFKEYLKTLVSGYESKFQEVTEYARYYDKKASRYLKLIGNCKKKIKNLK